MFLSLAFSHIPKLFLSPYLCGADKKDGGNIYINGKKVEIRTTKDAVKAGIGYLSEDRKRYGLVVEKTIFSYITFLLWIFVDNPSYHSLDNVVLSGILGY